MWQQALIFLKNFRLLLKFLDALESFGHFEKFADPLESFQTQKVSEHCRKLSARFGNFLNSLESFCSFWNVSKISGSFNAPLKVGGKLRDTLESFWIYCPESSCTLKSAIWKVFAFSVSATQSPPTRSCVDEW